jgi:hypothetical protein
MSISCDSVCVWLRASLSRRAPAVSESKALCPDDAAPVHEAEVRGALAKPIFVGDARLRSAK